ncbi:MAG: guanylate kinase [Pseudomonadales bacterium]
MGSKQSSQRGNVFVIAAASGTGKTSLVSALLSEHADAAVSISHTTRAKRANETDGENYFFVDRSEFLTLVDQGQFIEHAEVFGNLYGTSVQEMERITTAGQQMILEIDWQGALQVKEKMPEAHLVFILPPSLNTLRERLIHRGQDDAETVARRHAGALTEIAQCIHFDYLLINDDFNEALADLKMIVFDNPADYTLARQSERHKTLIDQLTASMPQ